MTGQTFLLKLLFSKDVDVQEDYHISYVNKLLYSKTKTFLIMYKEHLYNDMNKCIDNYIFLIIIINVMIYIYLCYLLLILYLK